MTDNLAYYLTLFKIEGHTTWRAHIASEEEKFDEQAKAKGHPKVTEKRVIRIDRFTSELDIRQI